MKKCLVVMVCVVMVLAAGCSGSGKSEGGQVFDKAVKLDSEKAKDSYALGYNFGQNFKPVSKHLDMNVFLKGIYDAIAVKDPLMNPQDIKKTIQEFQMKIQAEMKEKRGDLGKKNMEAEKMFLPENAKKEGVKTTDSGLQYIVLKEGSGASPKPTDKVKVHYRGTLIDGTEFDSSYKRGQPAEFVLNGVIAGWQEALQLMTVGSKFKIFVPSKLGYGDRGAGETIGPNATLIFEIELLGFENPEK